ncbi:MAG: penicillin-binding protein 2 [Methylobacillus sp.]|jgi:penicillin-binding protein 2|nr:penicillin-binding protein 2 [Methylobacillus sp.]
MNSRFTLRNTRQEQYSFRMRLGAAAAFMLIFFGLLAARFFYLQITRYDYYHTQAENNRISLVPTPPARGLILDRNGVKLADNFFAYTLEITPSKVAKLDETISELSRLVEITPADRRRFDKLHEQSRDFERIPLRTQLTELEAARFAVERYRFPGVELYTRQFRYYPKGAVGVHIIGYIGRINDADQKNLMESNKFNNYKGSDHIGKSGLEQSYEAALHGITGTQQVENDAGGHAVRVLSSSPPTPGDDLTLTIDIKLQEIAEKAFGDRRGALVAIDPNNGQILAFVSMPAYDPNLFINGIDPESWKALNESLDKPLINRPLRGAYPPGSTFKPFVALAGLEAGLREPPFSISDPGFYKLDNSTHLYRDWKAGGHGAVDMKKAITVSCDTFFYGLAQELGIVRLSEFAGHFGFGKKSGIDLDGELGGLMPTPEWKKKRSKQPWYPGETVIVGIGQGYTLVTPMQLAQATAILANNGTAYRPHLVSAIQPSGGTPRPVAPEIMDKIALDPAHVELVKQGMMDVTKPGGTAASVGAGAPYTIAAKTGTAQVVGIRQNERYNAAALSERNRDHALFIAYAPADAPRIALAVIVENGGHGGSAAGPIARQVMDYYLLGKEPAPKPPAKPAAKPEPVAPVEEETDVYD